MFHLTIFVLALPALAEREQIVAEKEKHLRHKEERLVVMQADVDKERIKVQVTAHAN